ncbi:hypothetical protein WDW86_08025 [Bdellovibrionota bacterium FG-2]
MPETVLRLFVKPRRTKKESATGDTLDGAYKLLGAAVSGGVGCPTYLEVDSAHGDRINIREAGEGARWSLLFADRKLGRMNWMNETYRQPDICEGSYGEVTDSFIEKQSSGALVLTFHVSGYENGGCNAFTRAFHSNKKVSSRDVVLAFNKDTEVMTYTLVEQTSPTRNNEISVCIMQKTTNR